jgi:hypothetical protein
MDLLEIAIWAVLVGVPSLGFYGFVFGLVLLLSRRWRRSQRILLGLAASCLVAVLAPRVVNADAPLLVEFELRHGTLVWVKS